MAELRHRLIFPRLPYRLPALPVKIEPVRREDGKNAQKPRLDQATLLMNLRPENHLKAGFAGSEI
ncbi:MAG: hypothetical protein DI535_10140 [Citrobacter freundii]|nr:MAG: hypothetical protein DI535_10140 [Citrobacter freundii]